MNDDLRAPFPYFGGKSTVADIIWRALGDCYRYIEPCFGSGAVLLARPGYDPTRHIETVNDKDGYVANVWRGLKFSPDIVAEYCDWPVNHIDLIARRKVLIKNEVRLLENLGNNPEWHDPVLAGYWIWAASCWIGSGLTRPNTTPNLSKPQGVHKTSQIPQLSKPQGVHKTSKIPQLSYPMGVHKTSKIPNLAKPKGVHRTSQIPQLSYSKDVHKNINIYDWFDRLSTRLRNVQVVCGDWSRVCGGNWQDDTGVCGIFFDPPYSDMNRDINVYHHDCTSMAQDIAAWAVSRGDKKSYRIIIAGYDGEHPKLEAAGWTKYRWKAGGGYSTVGKGNKNLNRHRETLWFSPHCLDAIKQKSLFDV